MAILKIRGLHKKFTNQQTQRVLKGVSFEVNQGQHVFVIGETGSGKSTLLKSIYGIHNPDKGSVWFNNKKLSYENRLIPGFENMRLVEQDFNLKKFNTVRLAVESKLELGFSRKEKTDKTNELLELFQLKSLASKQILQISGGQQQRVALAQAFANLPQLLLLDEPFAHLDPQLKTNIFQYIKKCIKNNGLTVVTVTHDYIETLKHADKVIALENGKIAQQGEVKELYNRPENLYVAGLLGSFLSVDINGVEWLLRPENVEVVKTGKQVGELSSIRFCGHYYELELSFNDQIIKAYIQNDSGFQVGMKVKFNLNLKGKINKQSIEF